MVGALGAVMDVTMSIASAMEEIRIIDPNLKWASLMKAGMNIGGDIMGTMANTLILAYVGSAITLLLLFTAEGTPFWRMINLESIATEAVRALAGSTGIILSIPITAALAGIFLSKSG